MRAFPVQLLMTESENGKNKPTEVAMERLEAFEKMLCDIVRQSEYETAQLEKLKAEGREKSATYRQYLGNRLMYKAILEKYRQYGLID